MTPSQNANLVNVLVVGEKRKEEGDRLEREWWDRCDGNEFRSRQKHYPYLVELWKMKYHKELRSLWYFTRSEQARQKFLQEFAMKMIIYDRDLYNKWNVIQHSSTEIKSLSATFQYLRRNRKMPQLVNLENKSLTDESIKVLMEAYTQQWWLSVWGSLELSRNSFTTVWAKHISDMIEKTWWLKAWSNILLEGNSIADEGVTMIFEAINKSWWLCRWSVLDVGSTRMSDEGVKSFSKMLIETGWLREWVWVNFGNNLIGYEWVESIVEALEATWWLREWVKLSFEDCGISDQWVKVLVDCLIRTWWIPNWAHVDLQHNPYSMDAIEYIVEVFEKSWSLGNLSVIQLTIPRWGERKKNYARITEINARMNGKIIIEDL